MDDSIIDDSLPNEAFERVKFYKKSIDDALNGFISKVNEDENEPIVNEIGQQKLPLSCNVEVDCFNENDDDGEDENKINQVRQSINTLLTLHEPIITNEQENQDDKYKNRLHKRLNYLSEIYKNEDFDENIRKCVLKEQNVNAQITETANISKRLKSITDLYYPIVENKDENKKVNDELYIENSKMVKRNSVADLKKLFEKKMVKSNETFNDKPFAPELLPVREKKRLFEKVIHEENEARAKQYRKNTNQTMESNVDKECKIISNMDQIKDENDEGLEEMKTINPSIIDFVEKETVHCELNEIPEDMQDINDSSIPEENSLDLTFTAIDKEPDECPDFSDINQMHRSSTLVAIGNNSKTSLMDSPTKSELVEMDQYGMDNIKANELVSIKTISFYRKQQKMRKELSNEDDEDDEGLNQTPNKRKVIHLRQKLSNEQPKQLTRQDLIMECEEKLAVLKEEICQHNRVLSQASAALKLSLPIAALRNSDSRVEAERLLLISTEKRYACLNEANRLKAIIYNAESYCQRPIISRCNGSIFLKSIKVPLLNEFLVARAKEKVFNTYYLIALICYEPNVYVSKLLDTNDNLSTSSLEFDFNLEMKNLEQDFTITVKLFMLELSSKIDKHSKIKSIRRKLLHKPEVSPMAHQDVPMDCNFKMIGNVVLDLDNVKTTVNKLYRLNLDNLNSIIDNYLTIELMLKVSYNNNFQGYFDMQQRSTTFWNLRWFYLENYQLKYWRFQEQNENAALGIINLKYCINPVVCFLKTDQRHICMRANTFALVIIEPPQVSNAEKLLKGGLISKVEPKIYFISSQVKEESARFCQQLTETLQNIRKWETDIVQPYSSEEFDRLILNCK